MAYKTDIPKTMQRTFRMSKKEYDSIRKRMEICHLDSFSEYIRRMALCGFIVSIDDSDELKELTLAINEIASSIAKIAHAAECENGLSPDSIDEVKALMEKVWYTQRSLISGNRC